MLYRALLFSVLNSFDCKTSLYKKALFEEYLDNKDFCIFYRLFFDTTEVKVFFYGNFSIHQIHIQYINVYLLVFQFTYHVLVKTQFFDHSFHAQSFYSLRLLIP